MSEERDTHYQNSAKLLTQKLQEKGLLTCWNPDFGEIDFEKVQQATQLIAQHDYDLIQYTLTMLDLPERINSIPDMTEWPDE